MKIRIKEITKGCFPVINAGGDWIDLKLAEEVNLKKGESITAKLGVAMELPKGMEAVIVVRSSTHKNFSVMLVNAKGVVDNSYNGNNDQWRAPFIATKATTIPAFTRVCQFRIQPSQFATRWQKLKWLLSGSVKLVKVDHLNNKDRGGFGSTGVK